MRGPRLMNVKRAQSCIGVRRGEAHHPFARVGDHSGLVGAEAHFHRPLPAEDSSHDPVVNLVRLILLKRSERLGYLTGQTLKVLQAVVLQSP